MSTENAVVGSESETVVVKGLRPRNSKVTFVKTWNGNIDPATGETDPDVVADIMGVTRQTVMQKSSACRKAGIPLAPVKRKVSASNAATLEDLIALANSLLPVKSEPAAPAA